LGFGIGKIELVVGTKGTKRAENSPPPKLEFGIAIEEYQPKQVGIEKTSKFQHS
jgi:hypothetical protein